MHYLLLEAACKTNEKLMKPNKQSKRLPHTTERRVGKTYRELSRDGIEAHVNGVLEVGGVGDVGLVGCVRDRLVALDLGLERLLLALGVVGLLGQRPVEGDGAVG